MAAMRVPACGRVIRGQEAAESGFLRGSRYAADVYYTV